METLTVRTGAFTPGERIPPEYTCAGRNDSPDISWSAVPQGTRSIAVICDDPDAPSGVFTHWILYNVPPEKNGLPRGVARKPVLEDGSVHGLNNFGKMEYSGPCPPPGKPHRYYYRVFALDAPLSLRSPAAKKTVDAAMKGHIHASGEVMGIFSR